MESTTEETTIPHSPILATAQAIALVVALERDLNRSLAELDARALTIHSLNQEVALLRERLRACTKRI